MIKWNEYTWYSKWASLIFFILVLPILTFYIGTQYELVEVNDEFLPRYTPIEIPRYSDFTYVPMKDLGIKSGDLYKDVRQMLFNDGWALEMDGAIGSGEFPEMVCGHTEEETRCSGAFVKNKNMVGMFIKYTEEKQAIVESDLNYQ